MLRHAAERLEDFCIKMDIRVVKAGPGLINKYRRETKISADGFSSGAVYQYASRVAMISSPFS